MDATAPKSADRSSGTTQCMVAALITLVLLSGCCCPAAGPETVVPAPAAPPAPALQVPFAVTPPRLDADPGDPVWEHAAVVPALPLQLNVGPDLQPIATEVRLLWDPGWLYVRFTCTDSELYTPLAGRDAALYNGDVVEVFLDPVGDGRHYVEFEVNPRNDVLDSIHLFTAEPRCDDNNLLLSELHRDHWSFLAWNADEFRSAARRLETDGTVVGWIADFAIPAAGVLKRRGLKAFEPMRMRANFVRYDRLLLANGRRAFVPMSWGRGMAGCPHVSPAAMRTLELLRPGSAVGETAR